MSIYPSPKQHNGALNTIFNNTDYIIINSGGGGSTIAQKDLRYLKNSGVVVSSASNTTFDGTVDVKNINVSTLLYASNIDVSGLATMKNIMATGIITSAKIDVTNINVSGLASMKSITASGNIDATNISVSGLASMKNITATGIITSGNIYILTLATIKDLSVSGLLKSTQTSDTLTADLFRSDQLYSFTNGMVYSIISDATAVNSVKFINVPTTTNQSYIFTFILKPSTANSPYYIRPSSNSINVNGFSIPLYGLQNVSLPSSYTYIVQSISIVYNLYASTPQFVALTSVSAY